jgi:hypothetical protein
MTSDLAEQQLQKDLDTAVAYRIKLRRLELNYPAQHVYSALGLLRETYAYLEIRCGVNAQELHLQDLAKVLLTDPEWLRTGTGTKYPIPPPHQTFASAGFKQITQIAVKPRRSGRGYKARLLGN